VFQQGPARHTPLRIGTWATLVGIAVLLLWVPLHQRPGLGTLSNGVVIGSVMDLILAVMPMPDAPLLRVLATTGGIALNGLATGCNVGVGTLAYAVTIGPLAHLFIPLFTLPEGKRGTGHG
jgi:uncharacterized membrane protein YczE